MRDRLWPRPRRLQWQCGVFGGMRRIHLPVIFSTVDETHARAFVALFVCDALARSILISLVPLQAYALLGSAQLVSVVYFVVAFIGLAGSLIVPAALRHTQRRWMLVLGSAAQIVAALLFATGTQTALVAGLCVQVLGAAILEVVMNLYLLDHIPRRRLNQFEPLRLLFAGTVFAFGPWLGVYLHRNVASGLSFAISAVASALLIFIFWKMSLSSERAADASAGRAASPFRFIRRFAAQPRLALSWILAFGRSGWWITYYIYTPIYAAQAGYGPEIGGALVSIGMAPMLLVRVWGRLGARIGIRNLLTIGYGLAGLASIGAGLAADAPPAVMALVCLAACAATMVDGAGNVPFLRAVRPLEREAMTSVFMTFRHVSSLAVPGVFALVLLVLPLSYVFIGAGLMGLVMAGLSRYIPARM